MLNKHFRINHKIQNSIIRFKSVGFDGSEDKLMQELTARIELAAEDAKKAF